MDGSNKGLGLNLSFGTLPSLNRTGLEEGSTHVSLLSSGDGAEVIFQVFKAGIPCSVSKGWDGLEFFYIVEGTLEFYNEDESMTIGRGSYVAARDLPGDVFFRPIEDTAILYFSSRPVFDFITKDIANLVELAQQIEVKDGYTIDHCRRLQKISLKIGESMKLSPAQLGYLSCGALLHDVGKVGVPSSIIGKPGKLTPEEWDVIKGHPEIGREMAARILPKPVCDIIAQHHERIDGKGYPNGLNGDNIRIEARIISVADSYDAMTTDRPYRKAMSTEEAIRELVCASGTQLDPNIVGVLLELLKQESF